jgi:hypothetical protein
LIASLAMVLSAAAFLYYIPVLTIMTTVLVAIGFAGAFGFGLFLGRGVRHHKARRPAGIVSIDHYLPERRMTAHSSGIR